MIDYIDRHKAQFGVEPICRVLRDADVQIAPSTYYAAKKRSPSPRRRRDEQLKAQMLRVYQANRGVYGARKLWWALRREGIAVARCTVERLMRELGIAGVVRGRNERTTVPDIAAARPADLLPGTSPRRRRTSAGWPTSPTSRPGPGSSTRRSSWRCWSRMVVGWRVADHLRAELALDALEMAIWNHARAGQPLAGLVHHSDRGGQYLSLRYTQRLAEVEAVASVGSTGDSYDNALAESFHGLFKTECIGRDGPWKGVVDVEVATCDYVHWFNTTRLHSACFGLPPAQFEAAFHRGELPALDRGRVA